MSIGASSIASTAIGASPAALTPLPATVTLPWPVEITAAAGTVVSLPWPVTVAAPTTVTLPWPVQVLDAAAVGGLNGAGAWAAAPDGRWLAVVMLGDDDVSARLAGTVSVQIAADAARTAEFAFAPAAPVQPMGLIGRRVRIAFAQAGGLNAQTLFSGVVDVATLDLDAGTIACACHDQAQEVWANTPRPQIDAQVGGQWHVAIDGEPEDNFAYLQQRIQSVPASWALDALQSPHVLPWRTLPRSVTVRTADIVSGSLSVELPSRDQLRTRINVRMQYRYTRLKARRVRAQYSQPISFFLPTTSVFPKPSYVWLTRAMVQAAADSVAGWDLVDGPVIESPPPGSYSLGTELSPAFYIIPASVAPTLATGFRADYAWRGAQTMTEDYTISVTWADMESAVGRIEEEIGASLTAEWDSPDWSRDPSIEPHVAAATVGDDYEDWQPAGAAPADRDDCLRALLSRAWVRMWAASRTGRVRFALPCRPDLWLDVWAAVETSKVRAAGQVVELEHVLSLDTGTAITAVAVAVGMPGDQAASMPAWSLPAAPVDTYAPPIEAYSFEIGTFVGGTASAPPFDDETMIGFSTNAEGIDDPAFEYYPHQISMRAPALAAEDRDPRTLESITELSVQIPTDLLEAL